MVADPGGGQYVKCWKYALPPMAAQGLRDRQGAGTATGLSFEEELSMQEEIFEARREELLAAHPDMLIAVCAGEVFVGSTDVEAIAGAEAAHPDRPIFLSGSEVFCWCA